MNAQKHPHEFPRPQRQTEMPGRGNQEAPVLPPEQPGTMPEEHPVTPQQPEITDPDKKKPGEHKV